MKYLCRISILTLFAVAVAAQPAHKSEVPELRVEVQPISGDSMTRILVEAEDAAGLDSLEVACPEADQTYRTQLPHSSAAERNFTRSFALTELFPAIPSSKYPIHLQFTIRNINGVTVSSRIVVPSASSVKPKQP